MTAITQTEVSVEEIPTLGIAGTPKRRVRIYIRDAGIAADETLDVSTVVAGLADIEGIVYETDDGAVATTASTW